ncbi:uncharacterized protein LOC135266509 [Tribolium castaneum]|uniref:uncharacterized protein LOC135266509 n=1 Tax=Tribolium castaneum TaxID=7070 RepID=UPI0030FE725A
MKIDVSINEPPPPPQEGQIIDLVTPAYVGTPAGQEEFEELLLAVGGDWEELFKFGEEVDPHPKIVVHSDELIKPAAATGRKNLSLLRRTQEEEENFSDMEEEAGLVAQPVDPEKIADIRNQFEETAGGMRAEISGLKLKIEEKLMILKHNRSKGEKLIKSLQTKIEYIKETQEGVSLILKAQKKEEEYYQNILKNL